MTTPLPLSQLTVRPIQIPVYLNERIYTEQLWLADNMNALVKYYNQLRPYCEGEPLEDFTTWAREQRQREEVKLLEVSVFLESEAGAPSPDRSRPSRSALDGRGGGVHTGTEVSEGLRSVLRTLIPHGDSF